MKEKRFVGFYNPSVILTYTGVTFAFVSMYLAWNATEQTSFRWSIFFLMIAGLCDMFDGTVARLVKRTEQEKKFGIQLDSLCDIVCFGVTPATIAYMLFLGSEMRFVGLIAGLVLTICGVIRLAVKQRINKALCLEFLEIVNALADADQLDRNAEFIAD